MSTYTFTCPACPQTFTVEIDQWSWPFVYSEQLLHLDREHADIPPGRRKRIAEDVADEVTAELVRRRLLGR